MSACKDMPPFTSSVPQLMRGDVERGAIAAAGPRPTGSARDWPTPPQQPGSAAALDEEEVGGLAVAGMRQGPLDAALRGPSSQSGEGGPIQGDGAFGAEFSQRDLQPAAVAGEIEHAVQLEVKELPEPQPGAAQDRQPVPGKRVSEVIDGGHQVPVMIGREGSGQRPVQSRDVAWVQQSGRGTLGPAPDGEVFEERAQVNHGPF